ncbi:MAG: anaerobic ribonucleoside triphosphate reductase [Bacilli bacterium]
MKIIKRNKQVEEFNISKIENALLKAFSNENAKGDVKTISKAVESKCYDYISVENIQDIVEDELIKNHSNIAKKYITYRENHTMQRLNKDSITRILTDICVINDNDLLKENANMASNTPAGQMMQIASLHAKDYAKNYLISKEYVKLHDNGYIHIHDMDYYLSKTTTCVQYDLNDIYENGFYTKNGKINCPNSIETYATLATIIFQTNQNEQHGGQAIPAFDFFMAAGVTKSFKKNLSEIISQFLIMSCETKYTNISECVNIYVKGIKDINVVALKRLFKIDIEKAYKIALEKTDRDTYQAMQGFIYNLNTMHSRGGNQVVFSSINYGSDTSPEGRMVISNILKATSDGLGNGEIPIFPIQIFKVKNKINYSTDDIKLAYNNLIWNEEFLNSNFSAPNFDLFLKSIKTSAKCLFPNYLFLDASFNINSKWKKNDPKRYLQEVATMGCRTRVFENINGKSTSIGRGNLSFTTINLVKLAIETAKQTNSITKRKELFNEKVLAMVNLVAKQLIERLNHQKSANITQFPFMHANNIWNGLNKQSSNVGEALNSGTLGIGFIGADNAMNALFSKSYNEDEEIWEYLYYVISNMSKKVNKLKEEFNLNFSLLATPAEGLSGRFTKLDKEQYGNIKRVNDCEYYTNSFHVDVKQNISAFDKIKYEGVFHKLTTGGHITYVELDGEAKKNPSSLLKIIECMYNNDIGYGSINHPIDICNDCNYRGIIYNKCPSCNSNDIKRIRRITGYLTGDLKTWNSAKKSEEKDRVKHQ